MTVAELRQHLASAIKERNTSWMAELLDKAAQEHGQPWVHTQVRCNILPSLSNTDNEWFWKSSMSRRAFGKLTDTIYSTALQILIKQGLTPGLHFSSRQLASGKRVLLVSKEVFHILLDSLSKERHSALSLVVKVPKEPNERKPKATRADS